MDLVEEILDYYGFVFFFNYTSGKHQQLVWTGSIFSVATWLLQAPHKAFNFPIQFISEYIFLG